MSEIPEDKDLVVVYKADPAVVAQAADLLTKEGIDCVITEKADPIVSAYSLVHPPRWLLSPFPEKTLRGQGRT